MTYPPIFAGIRKQPGMYVWPDTYEAVIAYVQGYDAALEGALLLGFEEWLMAQMKWGSNLHWPALVPELIKRRTGKAPDIDSLFGVIEEFLSRCRTTYVIKAEIPDPGASTFEFANQKTMYGGKNIAVGDLVFAFASENEGGQGLCFRGAVIKARAMPKKGGVDRQTPRVTIEVMRNVGPRKPLGRADLKPFSDWKDSRPETELNFKFYRQATNKICAVSERAAMFLSSRF
jgi:hypothetical protein